MFGNKIKKTDEEIAFDITDLLFAGTDARKVEKTIIKELKEKRVETIDWLIDECRDKILELNLDDRDKAAVNKLNNIIASLHAYKEDVEAGYVPNPFLFRRNNTDEVWIAGLIWVIIVFWGVCWILH